MATIAGAGKAKRRKYRGWIVTSHFQRLAAAAVAFAIVLCPATNAARADTRIYQYAVEHATYGDIGTYTNVVQQEGIGRT